MAYEVSVTDDFKAWYEDDLELDEQLSVERVVDMLMEAGPSLGFPYSSGISASRHGHMRELRIQHDGRPYRVLYAFDPSRMALLLLGGDKTGDNRWYEREVPRADRLYDEHLGALASAAKEGTSHGSRVGIPEAQGQSSTTRKGKNRGTRRT